MNLNYYMSDGKVFVSHIPYPFKRISYDTFNLCSENIFSLNNINPLRSKGSFYVTSPNNLFLNEEGLSLITNLSSNPIHIPIKLLESIKQRKVISLNTAYKNWDKLLKNPIGVYEHKSFRKWNITVVGLGDVGGTLVTGLRLLGNSYIDRIMIYDKDKNKIKRWEYECNQIFDINNNNLVPVEPLDDENQIFDCDMFIFCVSLGVPSVKNKISDVRTMQFNGNSKIIYDYARKAKLADFSGIFAVMSDPVDLLCKVALDAGLKPDQIRGYGLGVMNARANYYSNKEKISNNYAFYGRAFGPHGKGLVIANDIENYNHNASKYLTLKAENANLEIRSIGFKPYIAPALSSGTFSIIDTIKGDWHYSSIFIGDAFMGCRNKLRRYGTEIEYYDNMPEKLLNRIKQTYDDLIDLKIDFKEGKT